MEKLTKKKLRAMYDALLKSRLVEEKLLDLHAQGKIPGMLHSAIGQEAIPVGSISHLKKGDVFTTARGKVEIYIFALRTIATLGVIDLRTLVPCDEETILESVRKTGRLVTVNDGYERAGGIGDCGRGYEAIISSKGSCCDHCFSQCAGSLQPLFGRHLYDQDGDDHKEDP